MNNKMDFIVMGVTAFVIVLWSPPVQAENIFSLADRLFESGNYVKARPVYEQALGEETGTDEQMALAHLRLGRCLHYVNKTGSALLHFRAVADSYPAAKCAAEARKWLGDCYVILNQFDTAIAVYRVLLNSAPDTKLAASTHYELAVTLFKTKEYSAALAEFNGFIERYYSHSLAKSARFYVRRIENILR